MRRINKILIFSFLVGFCFFNFSLALDNSDCGKFAALFYKQNGTTPNGFNIITNSWNTDANKYSNFLSIEEQNAIIDNESLNTAMLNLKKYCCENELGGLSQKYETCTKDNGFFNDNALESPYLFDHLFDVIMRRLNGLSGEDNIYAYTNMTLDDKGAEWRAWINEKAESTGGSTPQIIINQYIQTREQSPITLGYNISSNIYAAFGDFNDHDFLTYVSGQGSSDESKKVANAMKNYSEWTLYDRYLNACAMTEYFYSLLHIGLESSESPDRTKTINRVSNGVCNNAVQSQINAENAYVKLVIQQSSNLFLSNYIKGYMDYLRGRSDQERSKLNKIKNGFMDIVNAVPKLVKQCVH